jgi:hypothetical protein
MKMPVSSTRDYEALFQRQSWPSIRTQVCQLHYPALKTYTY